MNKEETLADLFENRDRRIGTYDRAVHAGDTLILVRQVCVIQTVAVGVGCIQGQAFCGAMYYAEIASFAGFAGYFHISFCRHVFLLFRYICTIFARIFQGKEGYFTIFFGIPRKPMGI